MSADSQQNLSPQIDNLVHDGLRGVGVVKLGPRRPPVAGARIRTETAGAPIGRGVVAGRGRRRRRLGLRRLVVHARRLRAVRASGISPRRAPPCPASPRAATSRSVPSLPIGVRVAFPFPCVRWRCSSDPVGACRRPRKKWWRKRGSSTNARTRMTTVKGSGWTGRYRASLTERFEVSEQSIVSHGRATLNL